MLVLALLRGILTQSPRFNIITPGLVKITPIYGYLIIFHSILKLYYNYPVLTIFLHFTPIFLDFEPSFHIFRTKVPLFSPYVSKRPQFQNNAYFNYLKVFLSSAHQITPKSRTS